MKKYGSTIFMIIFLVILLIPSAGMLVSGPSESENGEELVMPVIYSEEEGFNRYYLQQLSDVFESRFALRKQMVTGYSLLTGRLFGTSSQSAVITGTSGWLYYTDTLGDYRRTNIMSQRQINNCVRNLYLVNEYCIDNGIGFLFVIAPNKNSIYPEYMPYYYPQGTGETNEMLITDALMEQGIPHIYPFGVFSEADGIYYFERDSHWNDMGAAMVTNEILNMLGIPHTDYRYEPYSIQKIHSGDLEQMIYPEAVEPEEDCVFDNAPSFSYDQPVESNFEYRISTTGEGQENLLMYRDSFGSSLVPFFSEAFAHSFFSRSNSCQISDITARTPDILIIEKAERFLSQLCTSPSRIPAPLRTLDPLAVEIDVPDLNAAAAGEYITVTGTLPEGSWEDDSIIYIVCGDLCYEASPYSVIDTGEEGFTALLEKNDVSTDNIKVFID